MSATLNDCRESPSLLGLTSPMLDLWLTDKSDFPEMDTWLPKLQFALDGGAALLVSVQHLYTFLDEHIGLCKLIERVLRVLFSTKPRDQYSGTLGPSESLDLELCRWQESLPECLKWNRWEPTTIPLPTSTASLQ